uniref:p360_15R n=1 Tax=African swine fever virus TaxID=10497 RepID=A0A6G7KU29_ASF
MERDCFPLLQSWICYVYTIIPLFLLLWRCCYQQDYKTMSSCNDCTNGKSLLSTLYLYYMLCRVSTFAYVLALYPRLQHKKENCCGTTRLFPCICILCTVPVFQQKEKKTFLVLFNAKDCKKTLYKNWYLSAPCCLQWYCTQKENMHTPYTVLQNISNCPSLCIVGNNPQTRNPFCCKPAVLLRTSIVLFIVFYMAAPRIWMLQWWKRQSTMPGCCYTTVSCLVEDPYTKQKKRLPCLDTLYAHNTVLYCSLTSWTHCMWTTLF